MSGTRHTEELVPDEDTERQMYMRTREIQDGMKSPIMRKTAVQA